MKKKITKRSVDALQADGRVVFLWDTEIPGFGCKATPAGKKVYVLQYRALNQSSKSAPRRITLGKHGSLTPDEARKLAAERLLEVKSGVDPRRRRRGTANPTMSDLAERFVTDYLPSKKKPPRPRTIESYESIFRIHITPALGARPVAEVGPEDIESLHQAKRSTPYLANRLLSLLQYAFDQAERWGWREQRTNPALHIEKYPEQKRGAKKEVMLTSSQMSRLFAALDTVEESGSNPFGCAAIRFTFWTGWRINSEVLRLKWPNLDLDQGRARLTLTKTSDEEYRSLPAQAISILEGLPRIAGCPYVFPARDNVGHLTTVRRAWSRVRTLAGLDDLPGLGALRIHDLRHNVVSWDVSRGVPLEIAGKNVGHRSRRSTETYAHFAPDALKRAADERANAMQQAFR